MNPEDHLLGLTAERERRRAEARLIRKVVLVGIAVFVGLLLALKLWGGLLDWRRGDKQPAAVSVRQQLEQALFVARDQYITFVTSGGGPDQDNAFEGLEKIRAKMASIHSGLRQLESPDEKTRTLAGIRFRAQSREMSEALERMMRLRYPQMSSWGKERLQMALSRFSIEVEAMQPEFERHFGPLEEGP